MNEVEWGKGKWAKGTMAVCKYLMSLCIKAECHQGYVCGVRQHVHILVSFLITLAKYLTRASKGWKVQPIVVGSHGSMTKKQLDALHLQPGSREMNVSA